MSTSAPVEAPRPRLERPGPLLALVFAVALLLTVVTPFAVNAAIVDPRVHDLPTTGASIGYTPLTGAPGLSYRAPGGWFYRESELDNERQIVHSPDDSASIELRFVDLAAGGQHARVGSTTAADVLRATVGDEALDLRFTPVAPARGSDADPDPEPSDTPAGDRIWAVTADDDVYGAALLPGTSVALVVSGSGRPPGDDWQLVADLLAGAEVAS